MRTGLCKWCGERFTDQSPHQNKRYCRDACRTRDSVERTRHPCPDCGVFIASKAVRCRDCQLAGYERERLEQRTLIHKLWHEGVPADEIATRVGLANRNVLKVVLSRMKNAGWDIPLRHKGWNERSGQGGPPKRPPVTRQQIRRRVQYAVSKGKLVRPSHCERCGGEGYIDGHHADYSKPLEVEWLCHPCHVGQHRTELKEAA